MINILEKEDFDMLRIFFRNDMYSNVPKDKVYEFKIDNIEKDSYFDPYKNIPIEYNIISDLVLSLDKEYCSTSSIFDWWDETKIKNFNIEDMLFQKNIARIEIFNKNQSVDSYEINWDTEHKEKNRQQHEKIVDNKIVIRIDNNDNKVKGEENRMNVYRLEIEAYNTRFGDLRERNSFYSDVFSSLERALEEGKYNLKKIMYNIYENSEYCTKENSLTLEEMLQDECIYYRFQITEVDPFYADSFDEIYSEKECILNHKPTHIIYNYDYKGNLQYKQIQWTLEGEHHSGQVILQYPGDDEENAGEKFKIGDFVQIEGEDKIYIVHGVPLKENGKLLGENKYYLSAIFDNILCPFYDEYEYNLKKYEGVIKEDSPYMFVRNLYKSNKKESLELLSKLELGEIVLNENPSFRNIVNEK